MRGSNGNAFRRAEQRIDAAEAAQQTEHQQKRAHRRERDLRQAGEDASRHLDAHGTEDALPAQTVVIEHAGHQVAVDRVEDERDVEDEQRHVPVARVFHDKQRHQAAPDQVSRIPHAGARRADLFVFHGHVIGDVERDRDIDRGDDVVRHRREFRIELVAAQRLQNEQNKGYRDQRQSQQCRAAAAGPVIVKDINEERDRDRVINTVEDERRP